MKSNFSYLLAAIAVFMISSCGGKSSDPTPTTTTTTTTTNTGNSGSTGSTGSTGGTTTPYVVKTVGASHVTVLTSIVSGKMIATGLQITDGAGATAYLSNATSDLTIETANDDAPTASMDGSYAIATFPKYYLKKAISAVVATDSTKATTIKLKGFKNNTTNPYNQVNYVIVDDGTTKGGVFNYKLVSNSTDITTANVATSLSGKLGLTTALTF